MDVDLLLASGSPRRRQLLGYLGLRMAVVPSSVDESRQEGETPERLTLRLSEEKARASLEKWDGPPLPVLAADTVVVLDGNILGKPRDEDEALAMWRSLSGRSHTVITGYTILAPDGGKVSRTVAAQVVFKELDDEELRAYLATDEWRDKAGGYAVQGISGMWIREIHGSHTNVMGLPLTEVAEDLRRLMGWPPFPWVRET